MISYHTCPRASQEGKETGGMNVYVLELSRALARMGHHVDIFTRSHEANDPLIINEEPHLRVMHIPAGPQAVVPKKRLTGTITEFAQKLYQFIEKERFPYDIVHAHYYMSGLVAERIFAQEKKLSIPKAPFVVTFHTLAIMKNLVARDTLEHESQARIRAEIKLTQIADAVIASSESDREYLQYLYDVPEKKVHVVYPGIDTNVFHPIPKRSARTYIGATQSHKIVLFVGRVEPLKGIDTLLYAMKMLKKKNPKQTVCLWIVGGDTAEPSSSWPRTLKELTKLKGTLGIPEGSVQFVGRKAQSELPYFYNAADVVVMPSHYESFGMSALEAMGCGTPVIVTNVAGITSRVDAVPVSHVASVNNPLLLASQISHVLESPSHAKDIAANALRSVSSLTWEKTAKSVLTLYAKIS